jgi:uncharacterized membrane protein
MKQKMIILGLALLTLLVIVGCSSETSKSNVKASADLSASEDVVKINTNTITEEVQKFDYNANGVTVTYFAVKGSDGEIRTAFDACDVCGGNKGYTQQGIDIKCENCGKIFLIDGLGTQNKGYGCWPSYLSHTIEDGQLIIKTSELEASAYRFA